ncbi:hypothetical protein N7486_009955 [Penicillium sp. IBT 16267x]|nr:hypothetical protein N7486_009955 [Penicillium sp. IBT 16267x]
MPTFHPRASSELGSPVGYQPVSILGCDHQREPTPPPSSPSCESGSPIYDAPAFMLGCDRQREPTPPSSSPSCGSGSPVHDAPAFMLGCDRQRKPTPAPGLPKASPSDSDCHIDGQPAIVHGCDKSKNPTRLPQAQLRRKPVPPPHLHSASGPSASTKKSKTKPQQQKRPAIALQTGRVNNNEPSRDPEVYYSFPPSPPRDSKLKRFFRKAGKALLSGFGFPTQPFYSPGCFDVVSPD